METLDAQLHQIPMHFLFLHLAHYMVMEYSACCIIVDFTFMSILGTKHISESVEILPDSLTSPSSLEILGFDSNLSSQHSDEFVSPLASPHAEPAVG